MENIETNNNKKPLEQKLEVGTIEIVNNMTSINETQNNQTLTNEQKLEYISRLIQDVEHDFETNGIIKKNYKH